MVPIASFREPYLAHIAQGALEAAGIPSKVLDEYLVQSNWTYSQAIGGVKLAVADEDVDRARAVLNSEHGGTAKPSAAKTVIDQADACPTCGSGEIGANGYSPVSLIPSLFFKLPVFFHRKKYICRSCGAKW